MMVLVHTMLNVNGELQSFRDGFGGLQATIWIQYAAQRLKGIVEVLESLTVWRREYRSRSIFLRQGKKIVSKLFRLAQSVRSQRWVSCSPYTHP